MLLLLCIAALSVIGIDTSAQKPSQAQLAKFNGFESQQTINAPIAVVWAHEIDVANWPKWDIGLKQAQLDGGPVAQGTKGYLTDEKGRRSRFSIAKLEQGTSLSIKIKLPMAIMHLERSLKESQGSLEANQQTTLLTHKVRFSGFLGGFFRRMLGKTYEPMLPITTQKLKELAEKK
jgi:hypothetical protein